MKIFLFRILLICFVLLNSFGCTKPLFCGSAAPCRGDFAKVELKYIGFRFSKPGKSLIVIRSIEDIKNIVGDSISKDFNFDFEKYSLISYRTEIDCEVKEVKRVLCVNHREKKYVLRYHFCLYCGSGYGGVWESFQVDKIPDDYTIEVQESDNL